MAVNPDNRGLPAVMPEAARALGDDLGRWLRGLQFRLRGAVEASWVGWIPVHPRHAAELVAAKDDSQTGKQFLMRLRPSDLPNVVLIVVVGDEKAGLLPIISNRPPYDLNIGGWVATRESEPRRAKSTALTASWATSPRRLLTDQRSARAAGHPTSWLGRTWPESPPA